MIEPGRHQLNELTRERLGGLVSPTGEDDLIEPLGLLDDCPHDAGMAMAVSRHPPGGDRIDDPPAVRREEDGSLCVFDQRDRLIEAMLRKGVPDRRAHRKSSSSKLLKNASRRLV